MSNCRQPGRDARAQAESQAQAIIAQGRRMARQRLEGAPLEEEPMKRYAHPIPYCIDCPTPPPAAGLARRLGVSRASLYRALDALAGRGVLRREGRRVQVLQPDALEQN